MRSNLPKSVNYPTIAMDASSIKTMLETQERAYKTAMDIIVQQMNDRINTLENKVSDLTTSLQFSQQEIDDLKSNCKEYEKEKKEDKLKIMNLTEQVDSSNTKIKEIIDRINYQEDYSRRKNIRITGLEERANETWEQTAAEVSGLLEKKLMMPGLVLERAHRVGLRMDSRPRTIVARFSRFCDREAVMRSARKLKGSNIFLNDDLCAASQAVKKAQMPQLKQARTEGKIAYFRHTKLIIKERTNDGAAGLDRQSTEDAVVASGVSTEGAGGDDGITQRAATPAGDVALVETAGAWSGGRYEAFPSLPDLGGRSPTTPSTSSIRGEMAGSSAAGRGVSRHQIKNQEGRKDRLRKK